MEEKKILPPGAGAEALERLREAGSALLLWMLGRDAAGSLLALGAQAHAPAWAASPVFLWLSKVLAGYGVGFPLAVWWLLRRPDPPPERAALHPGRLLRDAVALVGVCYAANALTLLLTGGGQAASAAPEEPAALLAVRVCVLAPLAEEFVFRRLLLERLRPLGERFALAVTAVCFAVFHGSAGQLLYALAAGLVLGTAALRTGRLWPSILLHVVNNLTALLAPLWLAGLGSWGSAVVALIAILGCLAALLLARETAGAFPPAGRAVWGLFWRSRWLLLALLYPWIALFLWG